MKLDPEELAPRHLRVAKRVGTGRSYREVAEELELSEHTVRHYVHEIAEQLDNPEFGYLPAKMRVMRWWLQLEDSPGD